MVPSIWEEEEEGGKLPNKLRDIYTERPVCELPQISQLALSQSNQLPCMWSYKGNCAGYAPDWDPSTNPFPCRIHSSGSPTCTSR